MPMLVGCGSKPMVPFWGRCTTHFRTYFSGGWDVHRGYDLDFDLWPVENSSPRTRLGPLDPNKIVSNAPGLLARLELPAPPSDPLGCGGANPKGQGGAVLDPPLGISTE